MKKRPMFVLLLLVVLALAVAACGVQPTPTPTPKPTVLSTSVPLPTLAPTPVPSTPTAAPTAIPTQTPTPMPPTATPTRTRVPATPTRAATATPTKAAAPKGSLAYHSNPDGVDRVSVLNLETDVTTPLVNIGPSMDFALGTNAHVGEWSPDNSQFAYIFAGASGAANVLQVLDLKSGATRSLYSEAALSSPTWSPDGKRIAFVRMNNAAKFWAVDVINADGTGRMDIQVNSQGEQYRGGVSWSKQNALAFAMNTTGASDVYTTYTDGGGLKNLTNNPADDSTPVWSPDGKLIAFTSTRDGRPQIYVANADGSGLRRVSQSQTADFSPAWSPDGNWLAFASTRGGSTDIYLMDLRGGNVKRLTTTGADHPMWSR
ncbi:MAG TPA: hypothetical protein VF429_06240 [Anaerolineae bacterium]